MYRRVNASIHVRIKKLIFIIVVPTADYDHVLSS